MTEAMDLFRQASVLAADSLLRPPENLLLNSGFVAWRKGLGQAFFADPVLSHPDLDELYSYTDAVDEPSPMAEPGFVTHQDVILCVANGCLYDSRTGFLLPASLSVRALRSQPIPPVGSVHLQMHQPLAALPRLDQALVMPRLNAGDDLSLIKQLMAYLWPLLDVQGDRIRGLPVLLQPDLQASIGDGLLHLLRNSNAFPLLQSDLPPFLLIREAYVPLPSLGLMEGGAPYYVEACRQSVGTFMQTCCGLDDIQREGERIFVVGHNLPCLQDQAFKGLRRFLLNNGWQVIDQSTTTLAERLAAFRGCKVIAAVDSQVLLELSFLANADDLPRLFVLGDVPNLDVVLMARAMRFTGKWVRAFLPSSRGSTRDRDWLLGGRKMGLLLNALTDQLLD